jgi:regulatory protein
MNKDIFTLRDIQKKAFLDKLKKYCAYQERCHFDVTKKLQKLKADEDMANEIISELITENYLNEERFAIAYVRGKHRINKWGRNKITRELKQRDISTYLINKSLKEIVETEYLSMLRHLLEEKNKTIRAKTIYERKKKLFSYAYRKGYENELIADVLDELL